MRPFLFRSFHGDIALGLRDDQLEQLAVPETLILHHGANNAFFRAFSY